MNHIRILAAVLTALLLLPAGRAMAFGDASGEVTAGVEYIGSDNAKFNEYRYRQDDLWGGFANIHILAAPEDSTHRIELDLDYRSPEDIDLDLESMSYGMYRFDAYFQRMGHNFAFDARTLYSGNETGRLRIPDAVQAAVEAAGAGTPAQADALRAAVATGNREDIYLKRDRAGGELEWTSVRPLTFKAGFDYENRTGSRPYGGNFGFSAATEIFEPIDYDTYNVNAGVEYAGDWFFANADYVHSTFTNSLQSVVYDNPLISPATATGAPFEGRNALPPSNCADSVTGTLAKDLPLNTRITAIASHSWLRQDETLLPATINTALDLIVPGISTRAALPRQSAEASVDKSLYEAKVTSRPVKGLYVKVKGKYYQNENDTPVDSFSAARSDIANFSTFMSHYVSWISRELEGEATYEILPRTNVGFTYIYESESYKNGSSDSERTNVYRATVNSHALDWMTARLILEHSNRNARYPDYDIDHAELPWMRKFYAADRDRYQATAMVTLMPSDDVSVNLEYIYGQNDYDDSLFGLRDDRDHTASVNVDYVPVDWLTLMAYYTYENHRSNQRSRRWTSGSASNPYTGTETTPDPSFSNWFLELGDNAHTVGAGVDAWVLPEKVCVKLGGIYALVDGDADFDSGVGVPDENAFVPKDWAKLDETVWWQAKASVSYAITKAIAIQLGYTFESWAIDDYVYEGLTEVKVNNVGNYNGLLNMNTLYRDYDVHTVYLAATYSFD